MRLSSKFGRHPHGQLRRQIRCAAASHSVQTRLVLVVGVLALSILPRCAASREAQMQAQRTHAVEQASTVVREASVMGAGQASHVVDARTSQFLDTLADFERAQSGWMRTHVDALGAVRSATPDALSALVSAIAPLDEELAALAPVLRTFGPEGEVFLTDAAVAWSRARAFADARTAGYAPVTHNLYAAWIDAHVAWVGSAEALAAVFAATPTRLFGAVLRADVLAAPAP